MFVDTNVLVQAKFASGPMHTQALHALDRLAADGEPHHVSHQIIREYLSVVTRPQTWAVPLTMSDALDDVHRLVRLFNVLEDGPDVMQVLIDLCRAIPLGGRQVHDANIVATMLAHAERRLLTFNTADFARFSPAIELVQP